MFFKLRGVVLVATRNFSVNKKNSYQVTLLGAANNVGQPLALLLKANRIISKLNLHDSANYTPGVAVDLSHIETPLKVEGFVGPDQLCLSLGGSQIVILASGCANPTATTKEGDLLKENVGVLKKAIESIAKVAPAAIIAIVTGPINSIVPMAYKILQTAGVFDPKRLFGVTTVDMVRASSFMAQVKGLNPLDVKISVIGGHSEETAVPLLSKITPEMCLTNNQIKEVINRIKQADKEVMLAKAGGGGATLSTAYAAARFTNSLLMALAGENDVMEIAYVMTKVADLQFFATPILLGKNGIEKVLATEDLSCREQQLLKKAIVALKKDIELGVQLGSCQLKEESEECVKKESIKKAKKQASKESKDSKKIESTEEKKHTKEVCDLCTKKTDGAKEKKPGCDKNKKDTNDCKKKDKKDTKCKNNTNDNKCKNKNKKKNKNNMDPKKK